MMELNLLLIEESLNLTLTIQETFLSLETQFIGRRNL